MFQSGYGQLSWLSAVPSYCLSKLTQRRRIAALMPYKQKGIAFAMCPGWVRTEMGGASPAPRGADTAIWPARSFTLLSGSFPRSQGDFLLKRECMVVADHVTEHC